MSKPRLTDAILDGIIDACGVILAGDVADAFGGENAETIKSFDNAAKAHKWANEMQAERRRLRRETECQKKK